MMGNTPTRVEHATPKTTNQHAATSENDLVEASDVMMAPQNSSHTPNQSTVEKCQSVQGSTESTVDIEEAAEDSAGIRSKRIRRAPVKFVARPSKQGVGVEEGDTAFLEGNLKNVGSNAKRKSPESALSDAAYETAGVQLQSSCVKLESGSQNEDAGASHNANKGKAKSANEAKKRKREPVAGSSKRLKSNKGVAIYVKPVEDDEVKKQFSRRKSAISRRPRQVQPTEKILAHREEIAAKQQPKSNTNAKDKFTKTKLQSATAKSSTKQVATAKLPPEENWICTTCNLANNNSRKRCSQCQGWKGGMREDIRSPIKHMKKAGSKSDSSGVQTIHSPAKKSIPNKSESEDKSTGDWQCANCGATVLKIKKRCGKCQSWKGGIRKNIRSTKKKDKGGYKASMKVETIRDDRASTGEDDASDANSSEKKNTVRNLSSNNRSTAKSVNSQSTKKDEPDDECNLDDVACCLCKCSVDFGDEFFFLPESSSDIADVAADNTDPILKDAESNMSVDNTDRTTNRTCEAINDNIARDESAEQANSSAIVSSECSIDEIGRAANEVRSSPKTVIHPKDESEYKPNDVVESTEKSSPIHPAVPEEDDRKPSPIPTNPQSNDSSDDESEQSKPPFQLPRRFYDPGNCLILCDGPEHANRKKNGSLYRCDRAYHQLCHFIPVFNVPRGSWRCLICRYRDSLYLKQKSAKGDKGMGEEEISDEQLSHIFQLDREGITSNDVLLAEHSFEVLSAPMKAKLLNAELTNRAKSLIKTCFSTIRTAEHSIRAFTETSKARKGLMERIENMGLPQELVQCFTRIAQSKMRIRDLIRGVESSIKTRQHNDLAIGDIEQSEGADAVVDLMRWHSRQKDPELFSVLFPEGERTLTRRRVEPRTDEANQEADDDSNSSGVSLDNLRCACCLKGTATDENDLLLCDGVGCYRAFHMNCLSPKLTPEQIEADDMEHWFCPLCTAHGELIHFAQQEHLGDDFISSSPPKEWECAHDVFPEAELEVSIAHKMKNDIRDDEVDQFLSQSLGVALPAHKTDNPSLELEDEDEESDDDFDSDCLGIEDDNHSDSEDSLEEEKKLLKEKIDKDELDALSDGAGDDTDTECSNDNKRGRRSRRTRYSTRQSRDEATSDSESESSDDRPDVGTLDTANIVFGKRNRNQVDYRKLNDALFGDESDDDAKGADDFALKPKGKVQQDTASSGESEEEETDDEGLKPTLTKATSTKKRNQSQPSPNKKWRCGKCGNMCDAEKKRCGVRTCQAWRGGTRENIRSPSKGKK